jgi:hypothetical protein
MKKILMFFFLSFMQSAIAMHDKSYDKLFLILRYHLYPTQETYTADAYFKKLDDFFSVEFGQELNFNQRFTADVVNYGASDDVEGFTPLHVAIIFDRYDIVPYLISKGVDVNASLGNDEMDTPLDFCEFIINIGKIRDPYSLYFQQQQKARQLLLDAGADYGNLMKKTIKYSGGVGFVKGYQNPEYSRRLIKQ